MLVALFSAGSRRRDDGTEIQALRVLEFVENVNCGVGDESRDLDSGITHVSGYKVRVRCDYITPGRTPWPTVIITNLVLEFVWCERGV